MTETDPIASFPDALELLCADSAAVRLAFWWVRCEAWHPQVRFLYGYAVPSRRLRDGEWRKQKVAARSFRVHEATSEVTPSESTSTRKRVVLRCTLDIAPDTARAFVISLREGKTLGEACGLHGLPVPEPEFASFATDHLWSQLPTIFVSGSPLAQGRRSLVNGAGGFCTRLCPTKRLAFLTDEPDPDFVLRWLMAQLNRETGVHFPQEGDACGSFEVFSFPSLDAAERPRLAVTTQRSENGSSSRIRLQLHKLAPESKFIAQVRTEQLSSTSYDTLIDLDASGVAEVIVAEPFDGVLVRVWRRDGDGQWTLWDETKLVVLMSIGAQLNLAGLTGSVSTHWLQKVSSNQSARAQAFQSISQIAVTVPIDVSSRQPWEKALSTARAAVQRVHPPSSQGKFFGRGWGDQDRKLAFAEWLKETLSKHSGTIVLMDSYFDILGLDLISRASGLASELNVLTSTFTPSDDDDPKTNRGQRLVKAAEQVLPVLRGINLKIIDLRQKGGGKSQVFHDRYLLFYDSQGVAVKGFNLSTSLQSAATTSPILITPIPSDVLDDVADYAASLAAPAPDAGHERVQLFPSERHNRRRVTSGLSKEQARNVLQMVAVAQQATYGDDSDALGTLVSLGYSNEGRVTFCPNDEQLARLRSFLVNADLQASADVWGGLVHVMIRGWQRGLPSMLERLCEPEDATLERFLVSYLTAHGTGRLRTEESHLHSRTLAQPLELTFTQAVTKADRLLSHFHPQPVGTDWPIHLALIALIHSFPRAIDALVLDLQQHLASANSTALRRFGKRTERPREDELEDAKGVLLGADALLSATTAAVVQFAQGYDLTAPLLLRESKIPIVRALCAVAEWRKVKGDQRSFQTFLKYIEGYPSSERQDILGQAVHDLRNLASQARARGEPPSHLPAYVTVAVAEAIGPGTTVERLVELVSLFSGPLLGAWALSTHNELLTPMCVRGAVSEAELFKVWDRILVARMAERTLREADTELVQVWGGSLWHAGEDHRAGVLELLRKELRSCASTFDEPFVRSRNYSCWDDAVHRALWCLFRLWAIHESPVNSDGDETARQLLAEAVSLVKGEELTRSAVALTKDFAEFLVKRMDAAS